MRFTRRSLLATLPSPALAQGGYPARPVRVIVPFPPGGSNDALARPIAEGLARSLGQSFVIENRGGAGSTIGTAEVARSAPDGQTLLITSSTFATSAAVQPTPYDAARDIETVALLATAPLCVLAAPGFPPNDLREAVAFIRARPGQVHYGSSGPGSIGHLTGALFALRAGRLDMLHVPYRGTGPVLNDMVAGTIELTFTTITAAAGLVASGRLKLLGWTSEEVSQPGATPRASGIADYDVRIWWGLLARRGLPENIAQALHAATATALAEPRFAANLVQEGASAARISRAEGEAFIQADLARWRDLARSENIRVE